MTNMKFKRAASLLLTLIMMMSALSICFSAAAASTSFESKISVFPDSYKPYLRELHEKYPNWTFEAVETGLDWSEAVKSENVGDTSLVSASAGNAFKSKESGDYNADTNTYKQYDAGFVRANSLAISYFMDPRNFLNESGIFQFEQLSFSSTITVDVVEQVLEGSFMSDKKITYYNTSGKKKTLDIKYSEAIYNAGKKYNVNPCYLASKIINEVGKNGSGSTSGKREGYEGYYNFYNIGATSGTNPIANGLKYASSGTTYSRPWTDPEKAIMGGAEFIAKGYIANGQDTGYFQRFNVSPDSGSQTYRHQYMTDISGAYFQSNTTYGTYESLSMLAIKRIFKIPVYKNMNGAKMQATSFSLNSADGQSGVITASTLYVRSQPNTSCDIVTQIPNGTKVKILDKAMNTAGKYNFLAYPYWYHISFTLDDKQYTGYACADYVEITTKKSAYKGNKVTLSYKSSPSEKPTYISDNEDVIKVNSDGSLTAVAEGTANVAAFTSKGLYDTVLISVSDTFKKVSGLTVTGKTKNTVSISWDKVSGAEGYEIYTKTGSGSYKLAKTVTSTSYKFTSLSAGELFSCKVRAYGKIGDTKRKGVFSSAITCSTYYKTLSSVSQSTTSAKSVKLKWSKVSNATSYIIYKYNSSTKKYERLTSTTSNSYTVSGLSAATSYAFKIVSRAKIDGVKVDYAYGKITVKTSPSKPTGLKVSNTTAVTANIKWNKVKGAEKYVVYRLGSNGKYSKIATVKTNSYRDTQLSSIQKYKYKIKACLSSNGSYRYSELSAALTLYTGPGRVKKLKAGDITTSSVTLSWSKKSGATGYYIYRYDPSTKKYTYVATTTKTEYKLKDLSSAKAYNYCVRPYVKVDGTKYKGGYEYVDFITLPKNPSSLKATKRSSGGYTLSWSKVTRADGYMIYSYNTKTKKYVYVATTSSTKYNVAPKATKKYKVVSYVKYDGTKYKSSGKTISVKVK